MIDCPFNGVYLAFNFITRYSNQHKLIYRYYCVIVPNSTLMSHYTDHYTGHYTGTIALKKMRVQFQSERSLAEAL